jgi:hypothetical protein
LSEAISELLHIPSSSHGMRSHSVLGVRRRQGAVPVNTLVIDALSYLDDSKGSFSGCINVSPGVWLVLSGPGGQLPDIQAVFDEVVNQFIGKAPMRDLDSDDDGEWVDFGHEEQLFRSEIADMILDDLLLDTARVVERLVAEAGQEEEGGGREEKKEN